jgi:pilus assembly protein CpaC
LTLEWVGKKVAVEGEARDSIQVASIIEAVQAYLESVDPSPTEQERPSVTHTSVSTGVFGTTARSTTTTVSENRVINLIHVPGPQQVLLKVQVAELNRSALRQFGLSFLFNDQISFIGSNITGAVSPIFTPAVAGQANLFRPTFAFPTPDTTLSGLRLTDNGGFQYWIDALRQNSLLKILAEPNLVAMNGHEANFLAGGEFPVPVPQSGGAVGAITIEYKEFGVQLAFVPTILDDGTIRMSVDPEVSSRDEASGLSIQGTTVPGIITRRAHTTVEMQEGQTLMIAGLLQINSVARNNRIPGLGDLPIVGALFSSNSDFVEEKELVALVTPYLVESSKHDQVPALPGDEVKEPNDLEFYLLGRIEGRTGNNFRATGQWDDPLGLVGHMKLESKYIHGTCGYSR